MLVGFLQVRDTSRKVLSNVIQTQQNKKGTQHTRQATHGGSMGVQKQVALAGRGWVANTNKASLTRKK